MSKHQKNRVRIEAALALGPRTYPGLAAELGLGLTTAWRWLQILVKDQVAYVDRKIIPETGGPPTALYVWGPKPHKHKVKPAKILGPVARKRKHRKNMRESGEWEDVLAKQRAKYWAEKTAKRDPLSAAFFGRAD